MFKVTLLGTGTSMGVPVIGCRCGVCRSENPRNRRLRSSLRIDTGPHTIIIDAGPDFRQQALNTGLETLSAVLFTHAHADHILGLDEFRIFNYRGKKPIPVYATEDTFDQITRMFWYAFDEGNHYPWSPKVTPHSIVAGKSFQVCGMAFLPIPILHGSQTITAFRCGPFAYVTDALSIPEESFKWLRGVQTLIINALRYDKHPTHMHLDSALEAIARIGASRNFITHMGHEFDYDTLAKLLPDDVAPAHDGLQLVFDE